MASTVSITRQFFERSTMENLDEHNIKIERMIILSAAFIAYLLAAFFIRSKMDVTRFDIPWSMQIVKHSFNLYNKHISPRVNYPPIIPLVLGLQGSLLQRLSNSFQLSSQLFKFLCNGFVKIPAIVSSFAFVFYLENQGKQTKRKHWILILLFLSSPALIMNIAVWGQFDVIMVITLFLAFYNSQTDRLHLAAFWMTVALLSKIQAIYFLPIFVLFLFRRYKISELIRPFLTASVTFLTVWLPFMIANHNLFLPIKLYFSAAARYSTINDHAFNLWSIFYPYSVKLVPSLNDSFLFGISFRALNIMLLLVILTIIILAICKWHMPINQALFLYSLWIFTFTMQQHERYEITSLAFIFLIFMFQDRTKFVDLVIFEALNVLILLNQLNVYLVRSLSIGFSEPLVLFLSLFSVALTVYISGYLILQNRSAHIDHHHKSKEYLSEI